MLCTCLKAQKHRDQIHGIRNTINLNLKICDLLKFYSRIFSKKIYLLFTMIYVTFFKGRIRILKEYSHNFNFSKVLLNKFL